MLEVNRGACVAGGTLKMTQSAVIMKSFGDGMQLLHEGGSATAPQVSVDLTSRKPLRN